MAPVTCRLLEPGSSANSEPADSKVQDAVSLKFEADEGTEGPGAGGPAQQRLNFARPGGHTLVESSGLGRQTFFRARKLQRVAEAF
jgi:hypothetical protein